MRKIPEEKGIAKEDIKIYLLKRIDDLALYGNVTGDTNGWFQGFEVHKIRIRPESKRIIDGVEVTYPETEYLANAKDFGHWAWHYPNFSLVIKEFPEFKDFKNEIQTKLNKIPTQSPNLSRFMV